MRIYQRLLLTTYNQKYSLADDIMIDLVIFECLGFALFMYVCVTFSLLKLEGIKT